ncbi:MAG: hypothetical protein C4K47_10345 [Candidatus Thorarchaeota archaeon]|nr:MAG: hypothetical protein C4K47_10345 [Candidatus Thorarchaeota archaeon]
MVNLDPSRVIEVLHNPPSVGRPTILPDFFLDHFVITGSLDEFIQGLKRLAEQGGGNLTGTTHLIRRGGNSVNTASALLTLGMNPCLIVKTDRQGASLLRSLVSPQLDLGHLHVDGRLSATVSIEAENRGRRVDLMVSDSGSAFDFSYFDLTESDIQAVLGSPLVALLCLNHNRNAPKLAEDLFSKVHSDSKALTFMDMGDPSSNVSIVEPLAKRVVSEGLVDILGMNENEAGWFAQAITGEVDKWRDTPTRPEKWLSAAKLVSHETGVRVDFHTPHFTATLEDDAVTALPAFDVPVQVTCGAGDAWNAGNIFGTLVHLETRDRLLLSNSVAAMYVSSASAVHPTREALIQFLKGKQALSNIGSKLIRAL